MNGLTTGAMNALRVPPGTSASETCPGVAAPIRVMLVDDHKTVLWGLAQLIQSAAPRMMVVGQASSRAQLLAGLASANPDLILLDLDLDGECGIDCIEDLMPLSQAMVLVLTGSTDTDIHQQAVMRGARGVVRKLEPAQVILTAIEKVRAGEIWLDRVSLGRVMTALSNGRGTDPQARKFASLTAKERQIVAAVIAEKGARNKVIAEKLHMSEHTLRNRLTTIYSKLEVNGRMELYLTASSHAHLIAG